MSTPVPEVSPDQVGDDLLLDVREDDEWQAGHAPGAVHIPLGALPDRLAELPADRSIAVTCKAGGRAAKATELLVGQGRSARNVTGGMTAWQQAGLPMEADGGAQPRVL